ncbi:MAG: translocation/assembly module TamB [Calditrichaceae bacterium]
MKQSSFGNFSLDSTKISGKLHSDSLFFAGRIFSMGASSSLKGRYIFGKNIPEYKLSGNFRHLDLSKFNMDSLKNTDLNFDADIKGRGFSLATLSGQYFLKMYPSVIRDIRVDTARIKASFDEEVLNIKELLISGPIARIKANGTAGDKKKAEINFDIKIEDAADITKIFINDTVWAEGNIKGKLVGKFDSLVVESDLNFARIGIKSLNFSGFKGHFSAVISKNKIPVAVKGSSEHSTILGMQSLTTDFTVNYKDTLMDYDLTIQKDKSNYFKTGGNIRFLNNGIYAALKTFDINISNQEWHLPEEGSRLVYINDSISVPDFTLISDNGRIEMSGFIKPEAENNFTLKIDSLSVNPVVQLMDKDTKLDGVLDFETKLSGTLGNPEFNGQFKVQNLEYVDRKSRTLTGSMDYKNKTLTWKINLREENTEPFLLSNGHIPVYLAFSPFHSEFLKNDSLYFNLESQNLQLSVLQPFLSSIQELNGTLNSKINIYNTFSDLKGQGPIKISNAQLSIPELGTKYKSIDLQVELNDKELVINNFKVKSGEGDLRITEGSISLSKQTLKDFNADLKLNNFKIMNTNRLNANVDGEIKLSGSINALELTGELTIPQARIYYPAWTGGNSVIEFTSRPSFVIGPDSLRFAPNGAQRFQDKKIEAKTPFSETRFYKNTRLNLSVKIPRNTWLRSEESSVEVKGDLDIIKEADNFTIFGSLSTVRGYYELQGNRFQIEEGKIMFKGNPQINPDIDVKAVHDFREQVEGQTKDRQITVLISGTAKTPQFDFQLDGQPAEQKDVLSVLLFGRSFNNLSIGQQSNVESGSGLGGQASGFVTGQLIKQLSGKLTSELNLDVLQIESGQNIKNSKIKVGKYISPQVFVSVSQDFGTEGNQKIELEYEIPKKILFFNWFLQASKERQGNTAMDVILKIEW